MNTNDLCYKIRNGKLKKHSEQLNKYVAGLIDADGSFSLKYKRMTTGKYAVYLQFALCQSESNDEGLELLHALCKHYGVGKVYLESPREFTKSQAGRWVVSGKEAEKLANVLHKHLLVKASHLDNLRFITDSLKDFTIINCEDIKAYVKCSRNTSTWLKVPKHTSPAWLAGFIDGDGHYRARIGRVRKYRDGSTAITNELTLYLGVQVSDGFIIKQLRKEYRGKIHSRKDGMLMWQLPLGRNSRSSAVPFLKSMRKFSCIKKKYNAIQKIIAFHEQATRRD